MNEETYRKWDVLAKFIAPIVTVCGVMIGVWQFNQDQIQQLKRQQELVATNDKLELKRRIWEKQLDVYSRVTKIVGKIASFPPGSPKSKLSVQIEEFYSLYWGELIYVKDEAIEKAVIDFHLEVHDFLNGDSRHDGLKLKANRLIEACRRSSKELWFEK